MGEKYVVGEMGGVTLGKKSKGLTVILSLPLFHSCTFLSIQHYMRGAPQSMFVRSREVGLEGLHPH